VSRGVRKNALIKASERHGKERLYLSRVKGNIPPVRQNGRTGGFPFRTLFRRRAEAADKNERIFGDKPVLRQAILISTIVTTFDRLW
jgi:hypothetical protein